MKTFYKTFLTVGAFAAIVLPQSRAYALITGNNCASAMCLAGVYGWYNSKKVESISCSDGIEGYYLQTDTPYEATDGSCSCVVPNSKASQYRCAAGYYGNPTSCTSGCTACPSDAYGNYGTTAGGAKTVSECYIPSGQPFSDATGSGTYTNKCSY